MKILISSSVHCGSSVISFCESIITLSKRPDDDPEHRKTEAVSHRG